MEPENTNPTQTPSNTEIPVSSIEQEMSSIPKTPLKRLLIFLIIMGSFLIFLLLGLYVGAANSKTVTTVKKVSKLNETTNPLIPQEVINNQMFSDWSGRVKGRIKQINEDSVDISAVEEIFTNTGVRAIKDSNNPNLTTIQVVPNTTQFFSYEYSTDSAELIAKKVNRSLNELFVGDILEGTVKIEYDKNTNKTMLTGASFSVRKSQ